jgi:hypothetical protein
LYGANIIDRWTQETADGANIFWNVSTWDPYQVLLLKTALRRATHESGAGTPDAGSLPDIGSSSGEVDAGAKGGSSVHEAEPRGDAGAGVQPAGEVEPAAAAAATQHAASKPPRRGAASCAISAGSRGISSLTSLAPLLLGAFAFLGLRAAQRRRTRTSV